MVHSSIGAEEGGPDVAPFRQVFDQLPIPCLTFDDRGIIVSRNRACRQFLTEDAVGTSLSASLSSSEEQQTFLQGVLDDVLKGVDCDRLEWHLETKKLHIICSIRALHDHEGQITGGMLSCMDITALRRYEEQIADQLVKLGDYSLEIEQHRAELAVANRQLLELATTDSMTGLLNRRAFQDALSKEIKRALRHGTPFSLMVLDVDNFKSFNDRFGHQAGDQILTRIGAILVGHARETDSVARYGGEEFVVILSGAHVEGSLIATERFRSSIEAEEWRHRGITGSFGIATYVKGMTADELFAIADEALYVSKAEGKNRCTHGNEAMLALAA